MIDSDFNLWLIEINTNPCLELSCPVLMDTIPGMVENALKIAVDSVLAPPYSFT
jgi:tubulin monoglycylase TTLL3/8